VSPRLRTTAPAWAAALCLAALAAPAIAQIEPGRVYEGGERLSDPETGLTLTVPGAWRAQLTPDESALIVAPVEGEGYVLVLAESMSDADARAQLSRPIDMGDGVILMPAGPVQQVGAGHLSAPFTIVGAALLGTIDVRLTSTGLGVAFILLSPPDIAEARQESMRELALSLGVEEPAARDAAAQASGGDDAWEPYLRGRYLARFYTGSGYTESTELWLCSSGEFAYDSQGGGFGGGASGAMQSRGQGRWSATGAGRTGTLILEWSSGERSTLDLEYDYENDRLYVGGQRMLRGNNERCR
jgi:hypothetical protein